MSTIGFKLDRQTLACGRGRIGRTETIHFLETGIIVQLFGLLYNLTLFIYEGFLAGKPIMNAFSVLNKEFYLYLMILTEYMLKETKETKCPRQSSFRAL